MLDMCVGVSSKLSGNMETLNTTFKNSSFR